MLPLIKLESSFDPERFLEEIRNKILAERKVLETVEEILEKVKKYGDQALSEYTRELDGADILPEQLRVKEEEFEEAYTLVSSDFIEVIALAQQRIDTYHQRQKQTSWFITEEGIVLGQLFRPLKRIGIYVPGGNAAYPSSVLMNAVPAKVAGVKEVAMVTPPDPQGKINPTTLVAAKEVGVTEVYKAGGAQAIAALAYGTETIPKVDKITGPGNIYVTLAKKLVVGEVDIDMLAGPSEVVIVADEEANPSFIAADLLAQAEHAPDATVVLFTPSQKLAEEVNLFLETQQKSLKRQPIIKESLKNQGKIYLADSLKIALKAANILAPEHLELMVKNPFDLLGEVENAGAIFLGSYTPEAIGDYLAGPNHILPTGGTARFYSPLGVDDFIKKSSLLSYNREGLEKVAPAAKVLANMEGLDAHARSIAIRME